MDSFIPYFWDGAWFPVHRAGLDVLAFLVLLFFVYSLSDYRRGIVLSLTVATASLTGMALAASGLFRLAGGTAAFILPALAVLLAVFNIFGAGAKPSAVLEKAGYALAILFALTLGLSTGSGYGKADGTVFPLLCFALGLAAGTAVLALIVLSLSSLAAFFGVNRRDYVLVVSAVAIGLTIPLLVRYFPFTLR